MATQIMISNNGLIFVDDEYPILWSDKGKNWVDSWCPNTIHAVIWNNLPGQNEIQNKDASTGDMTGNTTLSSTSDAVGTTTVGDLLTWAQTRKDQIRAAEVAHSEDGAPEDKSWTDYDTNYS
jgi:hypothetical protein|tara:strand:- start:2412 stop:2777 length:366 start_codon:yes stop_codon:yes gene_type:complete